MPTYRYVILHHQQADGDHWDLMLEQEAALATWRLPQPPGSPQSAPLAATRIGDHRKHYLDYEGPVSGGRGEVTRFDQGEYRPVEQAESRWQFELHGEVLTGSFVLSRTEGLPSDCWLLRGL